MSESVRKAWSGVGLKVMALAAFAAAAGWIAVGPFGNLIFKETIGIGMIGGILFTVWKDSRELLQRLRAREPDLVAYAFGVALFVTIGVWSLLSGAHDIGALTKQ